MTRRKRLTKNQVIALPIKPKRYFKADPELSGHYIRVMPTGAKSYACVARDPYGKQIWQTVGAADLLDIEDARDLARDAIKRIKAGKPAVEPTPGLLRERCAELDQASRRSEKIALAKRNRAHP